MELEASRENRTGMIWNPQRIPIPRFSDVFWYESLQNDISPRFKYNPNNARIFFELEKVENTPLAIVRFSELCENLDDYGYWFCLGTLWVMYTGWSELPLWKRLFRSSRPFRRECLMKPTELEYFKRLSPSVACFRAHRPEESEWISYTLDAVCAGTIARRRGVSEISEYRIRRSDIIALFLRRGEYEILCLDKRKARFVGRIPVITQKDGSRQSNMSVVENHESKKVCLSDMS